MLDGIFQNFWNYFYSTDWIKLGLVYRPNCTERLVVSKQLNYWEHFIAKQSSESVKSNLKPVAKVSKREMVNLGFGSP